MEEYRDARDLFGTLLNLSEPWEVESVLTEGETEIHVRVRVPFLSMVPCPVCGKVCAVHDRLNDRIWRDADILGRTTFVHARVPRSDCPEHGVRQIEVPWARENSRFTLLMERMILSMVAETSVKTTADKLGLTDKRVFRVVDAKAGSIIEHLDLSGLKRVGLDDKSFNGYDYMTVFADIDTGKVIYICRGRGTDTLKEFRAFLTEHGGNPKNITDFSCDFSSAYISGIRKHFKKAAVTCDRFHLVKLANEAMTKTNYGEVKLAVNRMKLKYILSKNDRNASDEEKEVRDKVCRDNEIIGISYRLKESLVSVYGMGDAKTAVAHLKGWIRWARESGLPRFATLAGTVEKHIAHIVRWFKSEISNAVMEGINSKISLIKNRARGYRNCDNLISMCYVVSDRRRTDLYGRCL